MFIIEGLSTSFHEQVAKLTIAIGFKRCLLIQCRVTQLFHKERNICSPEEYPYVTTFIDFIVQARFYVHFEHR